MNNPINPALVAEKHLPEVSPRRRKEYNAIRKSVDARAKRETIKQIGGLGFGSCHTFWAIKKRILRDEYHMIWCG